MAAWTWTSGYETQYAEGTWIGAEVYGGGGRRARVRFPDGRVRTIRIAQTADTFFSIPANDGRGQRGYVSIDSDRDLALGVAIFTPYKR